MSWGVGCTCSSYLFLRMLEYFTLIGSEQGECFASLQKENSIQPSKTAKLASFKA